LGGLINRREKGLVMLSIADGSFAALAVLPIALVFLLAYGNRVRRTPRPSAVRTMRRRRD
jgi:hypothetical protein